MRCILIMDRFIESVLTSYERTRFSFVWCGRGRGGGNFMLGAAFNMDGGGGGGGGGGLPKAMLDPPLEAVDVTKSPSVYTDVTL